MSKLHVEVQKVFIFQMRFLNLVHCGIAYIEIRLNNGTFITVAGCWHSMIVVGIVAHTQEFFDKRLNFHQMALLQQHQAH